MAFDNIRNFIFEKEAKHMHEAKNGQELEQRYGSPAIRKLFIAELAVAIVDELEKRQLTAPPMNMEDSNV